jgi:hypothetical protein
LNALAIADIQPLHRGGDAQWLALTAKGCLLKINKGSNFVELSKAGLLLLQVTLKRDDYYIEHCIYPLAFFENDARPLLLHGTQWNRLDATDPATGELLTKREFAADSENESAPHALDYFRDARGVQPQKLGSGNCLIRSPGHQGVPFAAPRKRPPNRAGFGALVRRIERPRYSAFD